jgi:hypothetical protein
LELSQLSGLAQRQSTPYTWVGRTFDPCSVSWAQIVAFSEMFLSQGKDGDQGAGVQDDKHRYLSLTGVAMRISDVAALEGKLDWIKSNVFNHDPDDPPIVFHSRGTSFKKVVDACRSISRDKRTKAKLLAIEAHSTGVLELSKGSAQEVGITTGYTLCYYLRPL